MKPLMVSPGTTVATDEQLVKAAREGSDAAFEALVRRYRDRITAYVRGMVHDGSRAEDIAQDTFISALRSLRATDQEIAFRPWVFQIARNGCIDHLRKVRRTEEISIYSEDFQPDYEVRIIGPQQTDAAVLQRQDMADLQQAFGGLPDSQYEILLLREFEGLSYQEIGQRMGLTAPAVESMLARARRSLKGQYDEIATGERCLRMRPVITAVATGMAGKRDRRTLERHLRYCRYCRHDAIANGLEQLVVGAQQSRTARAFSRAAAFFPFPWLLRRRGTAAADPVSGGGSSLSAGAQIHISHMSAFGSAATEQASSALQKAVAIVAVATVASGGGFVAKEAGVPMPRVGAKKEAQVDTRTHATRAAIGASAVSHSKTQESVRSLEGGGAGTPPAAPAQSEGSVAPVLAPAVAPPAQDAITAPAETQDPKATDESGSGNSTTDDKAPADGGEAPAATDDGGTPADGTGADSQPDPGTPIDGEVVTPDVTAPVVVPDPPADPPAGTTGETSQVPTLPDDGSPQLSLPRHELPSS